MLWATALIRCVRLSCVTVNIFNQINLSEPNFANCFGFRYSNFEFRCYLNYEPGALRITMLRSFRGSHAPPSFILPRVARGRMKEGASAFWSNFLGWTLWRAESFVAITSHAQELSYDDKNRALLLTDLIEP